MMETQTASCGVDVWVTLDEPWVTFGERRDIGLEKPSCANARAALLNALREIERARHQQERTGSRRIGHALIAIGKRVRPHFITLSADPHAAKAYLELLGMFSPVAVENSDCVSALIWMVLDERRSTHQSAEDTRSPPIQAGASTYRDGHLSEGAFRPEKRRGRPPLISRELKLKALEAKSARDAAKILYQTSHPVTQQVKNVYSILRHFKRADKTNQTGSF